MTYAKLWRKNILPKYGVVVNLMYDYFGDDDCYIIPFWTNIQGGPKVGTPKFRLIARRFVAHSDIYLVNRMLSSTIRGSNNLKCSMHSTEVLDEIPMRLNAC